MPRYIWTDTGWIDPRSGEAMPIPDRDGVCVPSVRPDISEYTSPIDGRPITSRSHRRYDLEKHGCVEVEPRKKPRGYKNPAWTKKRGLPLNFEG